MKLINFLLRYTITIIASTELTLSTKCSVCILPKPLLVDGHCKSSSIWWISWFSTTPLSLVTSSFSKARIGDSISSVFLPSLDQPLLVLSQVDLLPVRGNCTKNEFAANYLKPIKRKTPAKFAIVSYADHMCFPSLCQLRELNGKSIYNNMYMYMFFSSALLSRLYVMLQNNFVIDKCRLSKLVL